MPGGEEASFYGTTSISLMDVLAGGQGIVVDKVIARLARADRQSLGLACKALQDEVAARWRCLRFDEGVPVEVLRSKLLPKLRGVQELTIGSLRNVDQMQDFYRLLLNLKLHGARIKVITVCTGNAHPLRPPLRRSARFAGQPAEQQHDWLLTADSLRKLEPAPHLERLSIPTGFGVHGHGPATVDAALLQPLLRASSLGTARFINFDLVTGSSLDLSACIQLQTLHVAVTYDSTLDLAASLERLQPAPGLKALSLQNFTVHRHCLESISSSLSALETVILRRCKLPEPDEGSGPALVKPPFLPFKALQLDCDATSAPSEQALHQLLLAMTCLQQLELRLASSIPRLPLDSPGLAQLKELTIVRQTSYDGLPDATFSWIKSTLLRQLAKFQRRLDKLHIIDRASYRPLQPGDQQVTTEDVQAFLDAAPPSLQLLQLGGFDHVQPSDLTLPAAAVGRLELRIRY